MLNKPTATFLTVAHHVYDGDRDAIGMAATSGIPLPRDTRAALVDVDADTPDIDDGAERVITIEFPFSRELLDSLLEEFNWSLENIESPHPERTGNCFHGDRSRGAIAQGGDAGWYENAAWYCGHCYPHTNPARLVWAASEDKIVLSVAAGSTKPLRAVLLYYAVAHKLPRATAVYGYPQDILKRFLGRL